MTHRLLAVFLVVASCAATAQAEPLALSEAVEAHIRRAYEKAPDLRDDAFSKMGGSSVASKAFLHCFATPHVDLGSHEALRPTLEYFNGGRPSSFNRTSEAAGVNWNLKYVLGGRPANFREELRATEARWALILFGANDAQNENEQIYLERLVYLVERLDEMGVVPILGSAMPRRNVYKNRWIRRFNTITEAVAKHWALPFIDYHSALSALPRKGLAGDGMHPNVLPPGGLRAACQLTEKGLRYGNNVRNLLTLQMLDTLRHRAPTKTPVATSPPAPEALSVSETAPEAVAVAAPAAETVAEAVAAPVAEALATPETAPTPTPLPFSTLVHKSSLPLIASLPPRCGAPTDGARLYRTRIQLSEPARLRASALDLGSDRPRVFWVRVEEDGSTRCVRRRNQTLEVDVGPGMWDLIVEASGREAGDDRILILIARDPR